MEPQPPPIPPHDPYQPSQYDVYQYDTEPQGEEPPLEDPQFDEGLGKAVFLTFSRALFQWDRFFPGMREDRSPVPAICLALFCGITITIVNVLINYLILGPDGGVQAFLQELQKLFPEMQLPDQDFGQAYQTGIVVQVFLAPIMAAFQFFFGLVIFYLSSQIFKSHKGSFSKFARIYAYSHLPSLFGLSYFGLFTWVFSLVLLVVGLVKAEKSSPGRAILTVLAPYIFLCCLGATCIGIFTALIAGGMSAG
ncbi:MAG: YIP1 family protein [Acidobacteria bacterium]|nr:YIP1 family protein [Acidobacteriota bacterium]MCB9398276.1 YIP1 family protein [Acidobacteriota bacterium]